MQTIEEKIIKMYPNCENADEFISVRLQQIVDYKKEAFKSGVEFAQKWIPIEEELPEVDKIEFSDVVLTKNLPSNIKLEFYDAQFSQFTTVRHDFPVISWRPIERI